ncbi:MAG: putative alpha/beta hydrolase [Dasosvirus sp.]|uniref:Putative alpha/beta hydrolase n=1 Tax=Dasosvirus sp. TaxID=2487764 RepID=A0A3G4ZVU5_9VIRU|nr:MAG: putative alpha/beta hydrolase [Dasosvirus sp.]
MGSYCSSLRKCGRRNRYEYINDENQNSENIGKIESMLNKLIFRPPDTQYDKLNVPKWMKRIKSTNGKFITCYIIEPSRNIKKDNTKYIVWSHGNACDLVTSRLAIKDIHKKIGGTVGIICYDYQGYGYSEGICRETNCYEDITVVIEFAVNTMKIAKRDIILAGHSLGTGVVVDYCFKNNWKSPIVLISPFKSIARVVMDPAKYNPTNLLIEFLDKFRTYDKFNEIRCPVTIYHGKNDEIIKYYHSLEMYNTYRHQNRIKLILIENTGHNDILEKIHLLS